MDARIAEKITKKAQESYSESEEIKALADLIGGPDVDSVIAGIVTGRLYNAFCYQTRRILARDPTSDEFGDFLKLVDSLTRKIQS